MSSYLSPIGCRACATVCRESVNTACTILYFLLWYINKYLVTLTNISTYLATAPDPTLPAVTHRHSELRYERS